MISFWALDESFSPFDISFVMKMSCLVAFGKILTGPKISSVIFPSSYKNSILFLPTLVVVTDCPAIPEIVLAIILESNNPNSSLLIVHYAAITIPGIWSK